MKKFALALSAVMLLPALTLAQTDGKEGKMRPPPDASAGVHSPIARSHIAGEVAIGERAPNFELDGSDGRPLKLSKLRGDWVLMVFGSRKEELTPLVSIYDGDKHRRVKYPDFDQGAPRHDRRRMALHDASPERVHALIEAVKYVTRRRVPARSSSAACGGAAA